MASSKQLKTDLKKNVGSGSKQQVEALSSLTVTLSDDRSTGAKWVILHISEWWNVQRIVKWIQGDYVISDGSDFIDSTKEIKSNNVVITLLCESKSHLYFFNDTTFSVVKKSLPTNK